MTTLSHKLKFLLRNEGPPGKETPFDEAALVHLLHLVEQTDEGVCSCRETFELLDEYVELITQRHSDLEASREEMALIVSYVQRHLELCPDCHEEYEALLSILALDLSAPSMP